MGEPTFGRRLALFLELYPKPDGTSWTARDVEDATNGFVTASYLSNLKADRIRQPGYDRLKAIAVAVGFPPALWYEPSERWEEAEHRHRRRQPSLARAVSVLMRGTPNSRTGEPFTAEDVARASGGQLTPDEVRALQTGELTDPAMSQLMALSEVFGVDPGFWYSPSEDLLALDDEVFDALRNEKTHLILSKIHGRPDAEKDMILRTMEHLDTMRDLYRADRPPEAP